MDIVDLTARQWGTAGESILSFHVRRCAATNNNILKPQGRIPAQPERRTRSAAQQEQSRAERQSCSSSTSRDSKKQQKTLKDNRRTSTN
ncbi:hypothetical protein MGYG_07716 [Nannizzia gypsea CBS 118893]|uniref:Uncharacterized protein n=1 Tax=Arthroderma gypseum (strain ATCC MYA-4604 / CBS 118893) TaxID=535722 RepID=E4V3Y3_ARTGP|nr:hypothetical protein MGYG_07716 [Nannizzia gypsea CBS 118893]EFR04707.1 hypothetical protein MGYG_07716 [Nannizzia gypsea CBS 118893]